MSDHHDLVLTGFDGATPLGFLAALGVLNILNEESGGESRSQPTLSWDEEAGWRPVLHGVDNFNTVVRLVMKDLEAKLKSDPILDFSYAKVEKNGAKRFRGLSPPVSVLREWLERRAAEGDEEALRMIAALTAETATDVLANPPTHDDLAAIGVSASPCAPINRRTLPTFFDFTSRNAQFLDQARIIGESLDEEMIGRALSTGAPQEGAFRTMCWLPAADAPGAMHSGKTASGNPVCEWLAFRALPLFPVFGYGSELRNTGCRGRRKKGSFVWPLWVCGARLNAIRSLLSFPHLERLTPDQRRALGIGIIFCAELAKGADGYDGIFSPSAPAF